VQDSAWRDVWRHRPVKQAGAVGLADLMAADGFDAFGGVDETAWRAYLAMFVARMGLHPGESILEVGCGAGAFLLPLAEAGYTVAGLDYSPELVAVARAAIPGAEITVAEAIDLDTIGEFDIVVSNGVFLYFPDLGYAAAVLRRMLAASKRGVAVLDVPDAHLQGDALRERRKWLGDETYDQKYGRLNHLYFDRGWFNTTIGDKSVVVETAHQNLRGYFNASYRFNVFAHSRGDSQPKPR
jgi:SAM-dependent methyltransferase